MLRGMISSAPRAPHLGVRSLPLLCTGVALFLAAARVAHPDSAPSADAALVGLYRLPSGEPVIVWSPHDGRLAIGYGGGQVRMLDGAGAERSYGPSFGVVTPPEGSIRFVIGADGHANALMWRPAGGAEVMGGRVPLREREVTFKGAGVRLSGTVIVPEGETPSAAVVFLHGSEPETREPSRVFAYALASRGIASLIYDKRGTGASPAASTEASFTDLAKDALAGVSLLKRDPLVRADRIGLFGPSQGAWVALAATQKAPDIAFLVLQSGDATTPLEQELYRGAQLIRATGKASEEEIRLAVEFRRKKFMYAITGKGRDAYEGALKLARAASWWNYTGGAGLPDTSFWKPNGLFDPVPALTAYRGAVLAVFGDRDTNKDAAGNAATMRRLFQAHGNPNTSVVVFERANHGIFETLTGLPLEKELPQLTRLAPGYIDTLTSWISHLGDKGAPRPRS